MKLCLTVIFALFLLRTALSGPLENSNVQNDHGIIQEDGNVNLLEELTEDSVDLEPAQREDERFSEYVKEIQDQVEAPRQNVQERGLEERQKRSTFRNVGHGRNVALQPLYQKRFWLGCAPITYCNRATCPHLYMEGADWSHCWGEVFRIYRAAGPGDVRVGDVIGLFMRNRWFSLASGRGHLATCPGTPTTQYGFASSENWYRCWGEVFKIYARGKSIGDVIQDHDDITLYYIQRQKWVGFVDENPDFRTCPGSTRPPPPQRYDLCWGEIFELWLQ